MIAGVLTDDDWNQIEQIAADKIRENDTNPIDGRYFGGAVVEYRSAFYWIADDFTVHEALPVFVRSQADALAYFQKCEHWHARGYAAGVEAAKAELRAWLSN